MCPSLAAIGCDEHIWCDIAVFVVMLPSQFCFTVACCAHSAPGCFCTSIISPPLVCLVTLLLYFIFCPYVSLILSLFPRRIFMCQHAYQVTGGAQKKLSFISKVRKNVRLPQFLHCTRPPAHKFISIPSSHSTDRPCVDHPQREGSHRCPRRILEEEVRENKPSPPIVI